MAHFSVEPCTMRTPPVSGGKELVSASKVARLFFCEQKIVLERRCMVM